MQSKAQVTVFIIIGLLILASLGLLYQSKNYNFSSPALSETSAEEYVQTCLENSVDMAIMTISRQGGYANVFEAPVFTKTVPYYYYYENIAPTRETIQEQFAKEVTTHMEYCMANQTIVNAKDIDFSSSSATVTISAENVDVSLYLPMTVYKENTVITLDTFSTNRDSQLGAFISIAQNIAKEQETEKNQIPLSYIINICKQNNITFSIMYDTDDTVKIILKDDVEHLYYIFAMHYNWKEESQ